MHAYITGRESKKNVAEYFIDKMYKKEFESPRKRPIEETLEEAQKRLMEFEEMR